MMKHGAARRILAPPRRNETRRTRVPSPKILDERTRTRTPTRTNGHRWWRGRASDRVRVPPFGLSTSTKRGQSTERLDGVSPHPGGTRHGEHAFLRPGPSTSVLVLVLLLEAMGALRWRQGESLGSSTSTALRAEYEYEYEKGAKRGAARRSLAPPQRNETRRTRVPSPRASDKRTRTPTRSDGAWMANGGRGYGSRRVRKGGNARSGSTESRPTPA